MEPRFGVDLAGVRVHTGPASAALCRALGAWAFAYGDRVFFGEGVAPGNDALTAHELAHVVQQVGRAPVVSPQVQVWQFRGSDATPARQAAYDRRSEIVARLNAAADGAAFRLEPVSGGNEELRCAVTPGTLFRSRASRRS